jgi:aspartyl-tRNA(Asn)/glutamyl-tRNA(Gln) amidotransferase subunit C
MSLTAQDVARIAELARIELAPGEVLTTLEQLNRVFGVIEALRSVDTTGVEPMTHPLDRVLRLREDAVTESDVRQACQAVAPAVQDGLYLVPRVIE